MRGQIFYDPDPRNTVVEEDREFVGDYFDLPDEEHPIENYSPWLLRIELDRAAMVRCRHFAAVRLLMRALADRQETDDG